MLQGCTSNGLWLEDMSWTSWGPQGADGKGAAALNTCTPDCASGKGISKTPVVVHAWNAQPAAPNSHCPTNVRFYADIVLAFPESLPPPESMPMNTEYEGMPAVHNPRDVRPICA